MTLSAAFATYLVDPSAIGTLADALSDARSGTDLHGRAELLRTFARRGAETVDGELLDRRWVGRACHVGVTPPADAAGGDLWFDPVEVVGMMLIPRPAALFDSWPAAVQERMTPTISWLATSATASWQVLGWAIAREMEFDASAHSDTAPATGLSGWTASRYATFFGKALADQFDWTAVYEQGPAVAEPLWPIDAGPELAGYIGEGRVLVLDRTHALVPDDDPDDDEREAHDEFLDDAEPLAGVAFRMHVSSQVGLLDTDVRVKPVPRS